MVKIDFHLHTSDDPLDIIPHSALELVDQAVALGFAGLAVTLHESHFHDEYVRDYARERGIVLLPGIEQSIRGKHVLLINFPRMAEDVRTFEDLARLRKRSNGLVIAPHPFYPHPSCLGSLLDRHADLFDAVEWSYFWTRATNFNRRAARWAREHGKPIVGNSDLHDLRQLGRTFTWVSAEPDPDAICEAIRDGQVSLQTAPVPAGELARVFGGMMWRALHACATRPQRALEGTLRPFGKDIANGDLPTDSPGNL